MTRTIISGALVCFLISDQVIASDHRQKKADDYYDHLKVLAEARIDEDFSAVAEAIKQLRKLYDGDRPCPFPKPVYLIFRHKHPYYQSLVAANQLIRKSGEHPDAAGEILMLAFFLKMHYPPLHLALAQRCLEMGLPVTAKKHFDHFQRMTPVARVPSELKDLAERIENAQPIEASIVKAEALIKPYLKEVHLNKDPRTLVGKVEKQEAVSYLIRGAIYHQKNQNLAKSLVKTALKLDPLNPASLLIGAVLEKESRHTKPQEHFSSLLKMIEAHPTEPEYLHQAARMAGMDRKSELYRRLLVTFPDYAEGYTGIVFLRKNQLSDVLQKHGIFFLNKPRFWEFAGETMLEKGLAVPFLTEAVQRESVDAEIMLAFLQHVQDGVDENLYLQTRERYYEITVQHYQQALASLDPFLAQEILQKPWGKLFPTVLTSETPQNWRELAALSIAFKAIAPTDKPLTIEPVNSLAELEDWPYLYEVLGDYYYQENQMWNSELIYKKTKELAEQQGEDRPWLVMKIENARTRRSDKIARLVFSGFLMVYSNSGSYYSLDSPLNTNHLIFAGKKGTEQSVLAHTTSPVFSPFGVKRQTLEMCQEFVGLKSDNHHLEVGHRLNLLNEFLAKLEKSKTSDK